MIKKLSMLAIAVTCTLFDNDCAAMLDMYGGERAPETIVGVRRSLKNLYVKSTDLVQHLNWKLMDVSKGIDLALAANSDFDKLLVRCLYISCDASIDPRNVLNLLLLSHHHITTKSSALSMDGVKPKNTTLYSLVPLIMEALKDGPLRGLDDRSDRIESLVSFILEMGKLTTDQDEKILRSKNEDSNVVNVFLARLNGLHHPNDSHFTRKFKRNYFQVPQNVSNVLLYVFLQLHCSLKKPLPTMIHKPGEGMIDENDYIIVSEAVKSKSSISSVESSNTAFIRSRAADLELHSHYSRSVSEKSFQAVKATTYPAYDVDEKGMKALKVLVNMIISNL